MGNNAIFVLGAGRCGTSLTMQVLAALGMSLSKELVGPRPHNKLGAFEDVRFSALVDELLNRSGVVRTLPLPAQDLPSQAANGFVREAGKLFKQNVDDASTIWGLKDPYVAHIMPLLTRAMNYNGIVPRYVLAVRNPAQSVISRERHFGTHKSASELIWALNYCDALLGTGGDCFIVHYEQWFEHGPEVARGLLGFTGLEAFFHGDVEQVLGGVVRKDLNRAQYEEYVCTNPVTNELYALLRRYSGAGFPKDEVLERVRELRRTLGHFDGWIREHARRAGSGAGDERRVRALEAEADELRRANAAQSTEIKRLADEYRKDLKEREQAAEAAHKAELAEVLWREAECGKRCARLAADVDYLESQASRRRRQAPDDKGGKEPAKPERQASPTAQAPAGPDLRQARVQALQVRRSYSFRIGNLLISAVAKPGWNTLRLPVDLVRLLASAARTKGKVDVRPIARASVPGTVDSWLADERMWRGSASFQLGQVLINAVFRPGRNTVMAPFRLAGLVVEQLTLKKMA